MNLGYCYGFFFSIEPKESIVRKCSKKIRFRYFGGTYKEISTPKYNFK